MLFQRLMSVCVLCACSCAGFADIVVVPFPDDTGTGAEQIDMVETSNGDLVLLLRSVKYGPTRDVPRSRETEIALWFITPEGTVRRRVVLPPGNYWGMAAYDGGVALLQPSWTTAPGLPNRVVVLRAREEVPRVVFELERTTDPILGSSPDGAALYVTVRERSGRTLLTKFGRDEQQQWQIAFDASQISKVAPTDTGVALLQSNRGDDRKYHRMLTFVSSEGKVEWSVPAPIDDLGSAHALFLRSGFIAIAERTRDEQHRIHRHDVATGNLVGTHLTAPFSRVYESTDGALLASTVPEHPYLAFVGDDGRLAWQSRFVAPDGIGNVLNARVTRDGRLAFILRSRPEYGATKTALVLTDRTAASLQEEWGKCTQFDLLPTLELERRLRRFHGMQISVVRERSGRDPCKRPSDADYAAFVREVSARMGPDTRQADYNRRIFVGVGAGPEAIRLRRFAVGDTISDAPSTSAVIEARYDAGAQLADYTKTAVNPSIDWLSAWRGRVKDLTGCWITVRDDKGDATLLRELEQAAGIVERRLAALSWQDLEASHKLPYCGSMIVTRDGFGSYARASPPLTATGDTFLRLIEDVRREQQRREQR